MKQRATVVCSSGTRLLLVSRDGARWSLPGGRPKTGEALQRTASRELLEETSLHATDVRYIFAVNGINTCHHVFLAGYSEATRLAPRNEITHCRWAKIAEISRLDTSVATRAIVEILVMSADRSNGSAAPYRQRAKTLPEQAQVAFDANAWFA
ncbi:NUDIX domain-containing protein [Paraburkholderia sp.]|uniref:NUDIX hydrolase n=1 Tax=Paraburkholderia sp. TaxID=1926495 RepID=UPI0023828719|nr:NUDIX domain-containing protein [Paraburkholderia sp.]MDE1181098.1 NUDIX domain-containing protein [Paraburkholderia sp.]